MLDEAKQWDGWGTALKPACEPICFGRKPLIGTVVANVLEHGTGAINVDGCRIHADDAQGYTYTVARTMPGAGQSKTGEREQEDVTFTGMTKDGRWPANVITTIPEDEYELKPFTSTEQKRELYRWLGENA